MLTVPRPPVLPSSLQTAIAIVFVPFGRRIPVGTGNEVWGPTWLM
jgi:hypothetical protein